jgi:predicted amidohydrolase
LQHVRRGFASGLTTLAFSQLAACFQVYLVLGMAEYDRTADKCYNAQIVIGPDGQIIGTYRKVHLFGSDHNWAEKGDSGYQAVDVEWGRIGLGICFDINYREFLDFISGTHVDIFAFSTNWVGDELPF